MKASDIIFDGMLDFIFCSSDVCTENKYEDKSAEIQVVSIRDPNITAKNLEFRVVYQKESIYIVHKPFDYEHSNGVFFKLYNQEEYPIVPGSIIQVGTKN